MSRDQLRVELYVRSLAPTDIRDRQESVIERLDELEAAGRAEWELFLCGDCVCPSLATAETTLGQRLLDRYAAFERWTEESGRTLAGFTELDAESTLTGTSVTGIRFPRIALAEFRDGKLVYVAPSRKGTETTTVSDRIQEY